MSDSIAAPISVLNSASFDGLAKVQECGLQGMITLRGDFSAKAFKAGASEAGGVRMPKLGMTSFKGENGLCWMSPDELLILCPYADVSGRLEALNARLAGTHFLAVNVSDARAVFHVSGPDAREVLAKLCPVDLAPDGFRPGMFRRTRFAQVSAAFWVDKDESFRIICFRSVAQYMFDLLKAAAQPGSRVGFY